MFSGRSHLAVHCVGLSSTKISGDGGLPRTSVPSAGRAGAGTEPDGSAPLDSSLEAVPRVGLPLTAAIQDGGGMVPAGGPPAGQGGACGGPDGLVHLNCPDAVPRVGLPPTAATSGDWLVSHSVPSVGACCGPDDAVPLSCSLIFPEGSHARQ